MEENKKETIALYRYGIISPLVTSTMSENFNSDSEFFRWAANKTKTDAFGNPIQLAPGTIKGWYIKYCKEGFDGLKPKGRNDKGYHRKITEDIYNQITYLKKEYPRLPATIIYQKLIENGTLTASQCSLSTITRCVSMIESDNDRKNIKEMHRYEKEHINELWCGDSSVGPYIKVDGVKKKTYIIALIDDASRFIVGVDIFFNDNYINLMSVIKSAVTKYGRPKMFNFDNGANYRCNQMTLLAARIGTTINYNPPATPTSKAKIERWFRTLKDQWMSQLNYNDYHSLQELKNSLLKYVQQYNNTIHTSLNGKKPIDRFFEESNMIVRVPQEMIDKMFLLEIERKVSADNVILIDQVQYEVDYKYAGMKVLLRYSPDLKDVYVVNKDDQTLEKINILKKVENSKITRKKVRMVSEDE